MNEKPPQSEAPAGKNGERPAYEPPQLKKYGSLAELTRSGTGTRMENNMGPNTRFG
jgi:hypothetical protein